MQLLIISFEKHAFQDKPKIFTDILFVKLAFKLTAFARQVHHTYVETQWDCNQQYV